MRLPAVLLLACIASAAHAQGPVRIVAPAARPAPAPADPRTVGIIVQGGLEPGCDDAGNAPERRGAVAIGPKQDDPRSPVGVAARPGDDNDPKARGGALAIGPKQDDPHSPVGAAARPGDDNDPQARGGVLAIGPKQDDPGRPGASVRTGRQDGNAGSLRGPGVLAIGPKQDDPRSPAATAARPGDDTDPKARCAPRAR
ncbi:MAG: hypothetical protein ACOY37_13355 [Pseudomonadota bacterium]